MFKSFKNIVRYVINTGPGEKDNMDPGGKDKKSLRMLTELFEEENTVNE